MEIAMRTLVTALSSARQTRRVLEAATGRALAPARDMRVIEVCILSTGLIRDRVRGPRSNRHAVRECGENFFSVGAKGQRRKEAKKVTVNDISWCDLC